MVNSIKDGKIEKLNSVSTIADGIAVKDPVLLHMSFAQSM